MTKALASQFERVSDRLEQERSALNRSDSLNGNHGDHMVDIFRIATQAAEQMPGDDVASAMELASSMLGQLEDNASAALYAAGLQAFAEHFRRNAVGFDDLVAYIQASLVEQKTGTPKNPKSGEVLKALIAGLNSWQAAGQTGERSGKDVDMEYLFDLGIAYLQARKHAGSKIEALAETAISVSPLGKPPYRAQSGKLVIATLLQAMGEGGSVAGLPGQDRSLE